MRVLITGANGLVGRNLVEVLGGDFELLAPKRETLDLADFVATSRYLAEQRPDAVVHCAGRVGGIHANIAHPVDFLVQNWDMGKNLVLAARDAGVKKLLNLGSSCMYPKHFSEAISEDNILSGQLEPTNEGYAIAKIAVQRLCAYVRREDDACQYKTLVPCNLYGRYDKFSPEHSHLVPAVIKKIHDAKRLGCETVEIWGDGEARREFMYCEDFARIVAQCLARIEQLPEVMNVGLGYDHSINDYYRLTAEVAGYSGGFYHDLSKPSGMRRKLVDISRMRELGFEAGHSLKQGLQKTYDYYLQEVADD